MLASVAAAQTTTQASDGNNAWPNRSNEVAQLLQFHEADILGLQEAFIGQIEDIHKQLPSMQWVGVGRDDGRTAGEFSPLFFNQNKFKLLQKGWFWLSETPEKPGLGWDAAYNRICTWLMLKDIKSKSQFMVLNTHFDHIGDKARAESAQLILNKIKQINSKNYPVILMGDFNLSPERQPITLITRELKDAKAISVMKPYGPEGTFNGFQFDSPLTERIDYIFVSDRVEVKKYGVLSDSKNQRYPSDHLPVFVSIDFKK
jgi:endonuclease/exonuclease/phosphatase family metal-dependent hydrolase